MATPYAELPDLELRFPRDLTSDEETRAETLLGDASLRLGVWVPGLQEAAAIDDQVAEMAKLVVVDMVKRALLAAVPDNPGVEAFNQVAGPFQQQVTYRNPEGNLYLYDRELSDLLSLLRPSRSTAVSMMSPGL